MSAFKRTQTEDLSISKLVLHADGNADAWWKRLAFPTVIKESGNISSMDVCESSKAPILGLTCGSRIQFYNVNTCHGAPGGTHRFRKPAHGLSIRPDGQLFAVGGEECLVKLFSLKHSRGSQLRQFSGHTRAVWSTCFLKDGFRIASFSDDKTVRVWDVATEKTIVCLQGAHTDFIRSGGVGNQNQDLLFSCSFDGTVKTWDVRASPSSQSQCTGTLQHGHPVEAGLLYPNDALLVTAGGTTIKVWDLLTGGRLLHSMSCHHKTITAMSFAPSENTLLSSGLDKHVKLYDGATFDLMHSLTFSGPVMKLNFNQSHKVLAGAMPEGLLSIQKIQPPKDPNVPSAKAKKDISYRFRINKGSYVTDDFIVKMGPSDDQRKNIPRHDHFLRTFKYSKALDSVLKPHFLRHKHDTLVGVLRELLRVGGLRKALLGRRPDSLKPLVEFLGANIGKQRYCRILIQVIWVLIETFQEDLKALQPDPELVDLFQELENSTSSLVAELFAMSRCLGLMDVILTMSGTGSAVGTETSSEPNSQKLTAFSDESLSKALKPSGSTTIDELPQVIIGEPIFESLMDQT